MILMSLDGTNTYIFAKQPVCAVHFDYEMVFSGGTNIGHVSCSREMNGCFHLGTISTIK